MAKFNRPNKTSLKNAQHYEFIDSFITVMTASGFTAAKITALLAQLRTAFSEEDRWYMVARASEIIALRDAADKRRDNYYSRLYAIIRAWAGSGMDVLDAAATALAKPFSLYKVKTGAQIDEESGQLDNLITDISGQQMQAHIATLNLTWLYNQMVAAHQETKSYRLEQGVEESEKVAGALRKARLACDAVYDELTYLIEAFAKTADDPAPYEAFIQRWNGSLKIYQDMLDRKGASSTGSAGTPGSSGTPGTSGSGSAGGSGTTPGGDSGSGSGTGTTPGGDSGSGSGTGTTPGGDSGSGTGTGTTPGGDSGSGSGGSSGSGGGSDPDPDSGDGME